MAQPSAGGMAAPVPQMAPMQPPQSAGAPMAGVMGGMPPPAVAPQASAYQPAPAVPPPGESAQLDPQIVAARQAYANRQYQDSIRVYRGYLARNDDDPSAFGELGNVLLSAGRPQEAAQAYYEASSRLIDFGQPGSVYLLLPHIEQHDPLLAAVLTRRLASLPRSIY